MKYLIGALLLFGAVDLFGQVFANSTSVVATTGNTSWASSWGDADNDGDLDLYVCNYYHNNFFYRNNGNGTFTAVSNTLTSSSSVGHWGSTWVDYDDDGDLDMYVLNSYSDNSELLRNNGDGTYTNVPSAIANTGGNNANGMAWADTDNDGDLDFVVATGTNTTGANNNNMYYINNGNGTFTKNTTSAITMDGGYTQHFAFADYDNDGDQDLFACNIWNVNFFYENDGHGGFTRVYNLPFLSVGEQPTSASWGDFNNDGYLDLVVASFQYSNVFFNNGDKTFRKGSLPNINGNANQCTLGDFNNDGYLDIIFARTSQAALYYVNNGDETFTMTNAGELTSVATDFSYSGGAVGDYDSDGDLDVFIVNDDHTNLLFTNNEVTANSISVKLVGTTSNSQGIGAKVKIKVNGKWQVREIATPSSYHTQNSIFAHFGLGNVTSVDLIRVEWPSRNVQLIANVAANQLIKITEANSPNKPHTVKDIHFTIKEDTTVVIPKSSIISAFADDEGDQFKGISLSTSPQHGTLYTRHAPIEVNTFISTANLDSLVFTPAQDFNGLTAVDYNSIDSRGLAVTGKIYFDVTPVNDPPEIAAIDDVVMTSGVIGGTKSVSFTVTDVDSPMSSIVLSAHSSDQDFLTDTDFTFEGTGNARTLHVILKESGDAEIGISAKDDYNAEGTGFFHFTTTGIVTAIESPGSSEGTIYPNPSQTELHVRISEATTPEIGYTIVDNVGQSVISGIAVRDAGGNISIKISTLRAGIYFLHTQNSKRIQLFKFVKE